MLLFSDLLIWLNLYDDQIACQCWCRQSANTWHTKLKSGASNLHGAGASNLQDNTCGVFVMQGFKMQEVYNGRTFPEYIYDADQTVAVLKIKNKEGNRDYLYLPADIYSVNMMKERLRVQDLWECSVEEVHNLRLPESLVPEPEKLRCAEELTFLMKCAIR